MNLFHKKMENYPDNGKGQKELEQFEIATEWGESFAKSKEKDPPEKETYFPNALLFRSLLEGTSFDRRINKKTEIETIKKVHKSKPEKSINTTFQKNVSAHKLPSIKKPVKIVNYGKPTRKRKFITEKEQNRLEHIVTRVLGTEKD